MSKPMLAAAASAILLLGLCAGGCAMSEREDEVVNWCVPIDKSVVLQQLKLSDAPSWMMVSNIIAVKTGDAPALLGKAGCDRTTWNKWYDGYLPGFDNETGKDQDSPPISQAVVFGGRRVVVTPRKCDLVLCENDEHGRVLGTCPHGGETTILQTVGAVKSHGREYLVVIKSFKTHWHESRLHVFSSDFKCVAECRLRGRRWCSLTMPNGDFYIAKVWPCGQSVYNFKRLSIDEF